MSFTDSRLHLCFHGYFIIEGKGKVGKFIYFFEGGGVGTGSWEGGPNIEGGRVDDPGVVVGGGYGGSAEFFCRGLFVKNHNFSFVCNAQMCFW